MSQVKLQEKNQLYIGGQWRDASNGATFNSTCPANGAHLATCANATHEDVDAAVDAAWKAFATWKNTTAAISTSSHSRLLREKTRLHSRMGVQPPDIGVLQVGRAAAADKFLHRGVRQQDAMVQQ